MENINLTNYKIVDTFKETEKQKIYIGTSLDIDGKMVIINVITDEAIINVINSVEEAFLIATLDNLLLVKKEENSIILVTGLKDATPLEGFIEDNLLALKTRMDLGLEYLKHILKYDQLNDPLKSVLVDEAQIVVENDDKLAFDELLIIEDEIDEIDFNRITRKIGTVLYKILFYDGMETTNPLVTEELNKFIDDLQHNYQQFNNIERIMEEYRKHYIYFICMNNINQDEEEPKKKPFSGFEYGGKPKPAIGNKAIAVAAIAVLLTAGIAYGFKYFNSEDTLQQPTLEEPNNTIAVADFIVEKDGPHWKFINRSTAADGDTIEEYNWEVAKNGVLLETLKTQNVTLAFKESGTYEVSLTVKDSNDEWSEKFTKEVVVLLEEDYEGFNNNTEGTEGKYAFEISYDEEKIQKDTVNYRRNDYSYKIENTSLTASLSIDDVKLDTTGFLTFWIMGSKDERISVELQIYDDKQRLIEKESIIHKLQSDNNWEMVRFQLAKAHAVKLVLADYKNTIWIDDIKFELLK
ncbi:PKD domain-containing protein [Alkaliphilus peptidifermentans]|uniref:PKD domain-containing protein n=1 Tax=Alkaliphilus peptidifermentans DSM 18978 TaxID=1120976 RepID=A0A1G5CWE8_9FIRM|nr:PKD domain-containing protein [Alkaliphilus peptidifermentans]SCY06581.1 hypothetical protein SAMN03080606_00786 [Alkaliphilus peptidifermentans DSM 18978]